MVKRISMLIVSKELELLYLHTKYNIVKKDREVYVVLTNSPRNDRNVIVVIFYVVDDTF